ncbi:endomucin [Acomys russatus]|uniref:endomucin n=1 Tax=Acomys russatus TaxID=60746 RepID=UPI0021E1FB80|nr:endomucin [Acomys russatus]
MPLLRLTALFFLLSHSLCRCENSTDVENKSTSPLPETSTIKASVTTPGTLSVTNLPIKPIPATPPKETTTPDAVKNNVLTIKAVPDLLVSNAVSTLPVSQNKSTDDGKITATPSTSPSYSSIILPVVIALIVMTLLVFTLVGLYRMCWKRDPGTQENGNDQPQADKDSVKLLTVKTLSHESGEHSAQGKTKN